MTVDARWYAVHVYPQNEKKVATELERRGIKTFLPLRKECHRWSDRNKTVEVPLFPCYAFVNMVPTPHLRSVVGQTPRVIRVLPANDEPIPIPDSEIESMRSLVEGETLVAPCEYIQAGQKVRVRGGCLEGLEGILDVRDGKRNLILSINIIERSFALSLEGYKVEPL
jgi:transcription antitermination factor NusG